MVNIYSIVKEWTERTETLDRLVFKPLIGKFIINKDERTKSINYVHDINHDGLETIKIEKSAGTIEFRNRHIGFGNVRDYEILVKDTTMTRMTEKLLKLFTTLIDLNEKTKIPEKPYPPKNILRER